MPENPTSDRVAPSWGAHALAAVPLALTAWIYHPVLRVGFFADDLACLASIESDGIFRFLLCPFGGHNLLVRNAAFVATWEVFGLRPDLFFWTVLLTHLLNVWLLFRLLRTLTGSAMLACFGATIWGTSPLAIGTLGWYSVYGQSLAATILLIVLDQLARLSVGGGSVSSARAWLWYGLLLAGTMCFGVGIGVALCFPVILFLLLPAAWSRRALRAAYLLLPIVTVALYIGYRRLAAHLEPPSVEELMQEYILRTGYVWIPAMLAQLLLFASASTMLGFLLPAVPPTPLTLTLGAAFAAGVVFVLWRGDGRTRRTALAMIALAATIYFAIAAGRAALYAMLEFSPARAASIQRYHYVGSLPIVVLLCLILREVARLPAVRLVPAPLALVVGLAPVAYGIRQGIPVQEYGGARDYLRRTGDEIMAGVRAHPPGTTVYLENEHTPNFVLGPALPGPLFPGRAGVFVLLHRSDQVEGRTVRFLEPDGEINAFYALRPNSRLTKLLVNPQDVAAQH